MPFFSKDFVIGKSSNAYCRPLNSMIWIATSLPLRSDDLEGRPFDSMLWSDDGEDPQFGVLIVKFHDLECPP